jgi:NAD(P)-dependent dehydrogenase (short-subunit alcohol dehydrogenase family)
MRSNYADAYWTVAQMVAHHTINGCNLRAGDLLGSGTQSVPAAPPVSAIREAAAMLQGKSALITGSTSGIGSGLAEALAAAGAKVMLSGFGNASVIERLRAGISERPGVEVLHSGADMSKPAEIAAMVHQAEERFGGVGILVNNAGIQFVAPDDEFPEAKWEQNSGDQALVQLVHHVRRATRHEDARLRPHRQHRLCARAGGLALQGGLRGSQARRAGADQDGGA